MELNKLSHCPLCFLEAELKLSNDSAYIQEQQTAHADAVLHRY